MAFLTQTGRAPALVLRVRETPRAWAFGVFGVAALALYFVLPRSVQPIAYVVIGLSSVAALYLGVLRAMPRAERLPWNLIAVGLVGQVAGDIVSAIYEIHLDREPPTPSAADFFDLATYPLFALGIFLMLRRLGGQTSRAAILDSLVVFVAVMLVQWVFFIHPSHHSLVYMVYPAMDVLLLVGLAQFLLVPGGRVLAYRLALVSLALWVVGDELYGLRASSYTSGSWIDCFWLASYLTWGVAALDPTVTKVARPDRRQAPRVSSWRLLTLTLALCAGPVIGIWERHAGHVDDAYVIGGVSCVVAVLVLLRLFGLVRSVEQARLSERMFRRDAEQAQQLLRYQNQQLVELDRLKDEFVSTVTHELRTPLTSISGYAELLLEDEADEERRSYLQIVERNSDRLLGLVSDMLFSARLQDGRLELATDDVDLCAVVTHAAASARPRAEAAGVELSVDAKAVPPVCGEEPRLAQLLDNLISNGIKFTPAGGRVSVELAARDGLVCVEVSDTGMGIPEREREKLFERFFRSQTALERQIQGTGLGLYISRAIVEAHGGRIGVSSAEGSGTTFLVELPARD
jgi:signal transduction histidine kinase